MLIFGPGRLVDAGLWPECWQTYRRRTEIRALRFAAHGRSTGFTDDRHGCAISVEPERLKTAIDEWAPFAFTEGETIRNSFFGYTEGLSDARAERYFKAGARLSVFAFDEGSLYGSARPLIDDPHGMMRDVDLSFEKDKLAFAWKKSDRLDDYHVYEYDLATGDTAADLGLGRGILNRSTCPTAISPVSTRPEQSVPGNLRLVIAPNGREGRYVRRLAIDQVHTVYPQLLTDGQPRYALGL